MDGHADLVRLLVSIRPERPLARSVGALLAWFKPHRELAMLLLAIGSATAAVYHQFAPRSDLGIFKCLTDARIAIVETALVVERLKPGSGGTLSITPASLTKVDDANLTDGQRRERLSTTQRATAELLLDAHVRRHMEAQERIKGQRCPALVAKGDF